MDPKFQTSFIPKKPLPTSGGMMSAASSRSKPGGSLFMIIAVVIFSLSLAAALGAYAWKQVLLSSRDSYRKTLTERESQFNPTLISQLKEANVKIDTARNLLANHAATSVIFDIVGRLTAQNIRFVSMDLSSPENGGSGLTVSLRGYGANFSAIAFQSKVLNQLEQYGLRQTVKNPIISDPSLGTNGTVSFNMTAAIDPGSISYEKSVNPSSATTTQ